MIEWEILELTAIFLGCVLHVLWAHVVSDHRLINFLLFVLADLEQMYIYMFQEG